MALAIIVGTLSIGVSTLAAYCAATKNNMLSIIFFLLAIAGVMVSIEMSAQHAIESMRRAFEIASMANY
jgi:hypothetical protein